MVWRVGIASTRAALKSVSGARFGRVGASTLKNVAATKPETTDNVGETAGKTFLLTNLKGTGSVVNLSSVTAINRKSSSVLTDKGLKLGGAGLGLTAATSAAVCKTLTAAGLKTATATGVSLSTAAATSGSTGIGMVLKTVGLKVASGAGAGLSTMTAAGVKAGTASAVALKGLVVTSAKAIATKTVYGVTVKSLGIFALKGTIGGAVVLTGATVALPAAGFTSTGVAAGSWAALWQSCIGNVAEGSVFSLLQSAGAAGFALTTKAVFVISGAIGSWFF